MILPPGAPQSGNANSSRWLPWLLVVLLFSLLAALGSTFLYYLNGSALLEALLKGGSAFVAAFVLCLTIAQIAVILRDRQ